MRNEIEDTHGRLEKSADGPPEEHRAGFKARAIDEGKKFLIMTAYLWAFFAVLSLHKTIVLQDSGLDYQEQSFAIINALIFAKVMLVADDLKLDSGLRNHATIYYVLYASLVFAVVLICFHIAERAGVALLRGKPLSESLAGFGAGKLRGIVSMGAIAFVALIPFFTFRGIGRAVGEDQLWQLVFAPGKKQFTLVVRDR